MLWQGNIVLNACNNVRFIGCEISNGGITETSVTNTYFIHCSFITSVVRVAGGAYYVDNLQDSGLSDVGKYPTSDGEYLLKVDAGSHEYSINTGPDLSVSIGTLTGTDTITTSKSTKVFRRDIGSVGRDTLTINGDIPGGYILHLTGITDSVILDFEPDINGPGGTGLDTAVVYANGFYDFYYDDLYYTINIPGNESGAPAGFDADDASKYHLWLDFSDSGERTVNGSNEITQVNDKSGNTYHFTATTGSAPTLSASAQNSLDVADFDGSEFMEDVGSQGDYNDLHNGETRTIFMVVKAGNVASPETNTVIMGNNGFGGGDPGIGIGYFDASSSEDRAAVKITTASTDASLEFQDNTLPANTYYLVTLVVNADDAVESNRIKWYLDDGSNLANPSGTTGASTANATYPMQMGADGDDGLEFVGQIGEVRIANSDIPDIERNAIRDFLIAKWGL